MTDQPTSLPLADADLLAWAVVLEYREQQQRDGITILLLPFPLCPTCGQAVHEVEGWWVDEPPRREQTLAMKPCGHQHVAKLADYERVHDHATDMLDRLVFADRVPGGASPTTEWIVTEARTRVGQPAETGETRQPQSANSIRDDLLHAIDFNYAVGLGYSTPEDLLAAYDRHTNTRREDTR